MHFIQAVWAAVPLLLLLSLLFGDTVREAFYAILAAVSGRPAKKGRLSRKQEAALRQQATDAQATDAQQALMVATDILRDVQAADRAFPQLPQDTTLRVDAFLAQHLQRPALPREPDRQDGKRA